MKKEPIVIMLFLILGLSAQAQSGSDLKGPKAKNYKVWKSEKTPKTVYISVDKTKITGPEAKNRRPGDFENERSKRVVVSRDMKRSKLKGPTAKNHKPWL